MADEYIWVNRWEEFQSFQTRRGKPWAPPWIKFHTRILDNPDFLDLSPETRMLLVGLWGLFARTHGTVTKDTRRLSHQLNQRVTRRQLDSLNHAGFIQFCSETVLEQFRNTFWNSSSLEVEVEVDKEKALASSNGRSTKPSRPTCPHCGIKFQGPKSVAEHVYHVHDGPEPAHWQTDPDPKDKIGVDRV